ncbi:hypothetical protein BDB00DRAFT_18027 [Zychaea mexicana]|uniref:uncharacterized protein n=1 Tax=Zychaea mexicana TaxID=64656 RepID=UPI0022FE8938|nr:uncharacterized protein BDB00DRAFT_18027 [Zychaea mexicana]KAI9497161.1 hypothetical protein BDB00DRAFT_18027 [Zychaea mexicana]
MAANTVTAFVKRRFSEDDEHDREEWPTYKRFNDNALSTAQPNMLQKQQDALMPSITYASPDYRPPVTLNPLWLQPSPHQPPQQVAQRQQPRQPRQPRSGGGAMMVDETDSTDEDDLTTLVQTPSSVLDEGTKGSLESGWINGPLDQWHHAS